MTFKYSVKEWNQMNKNTFVKFGYNYNSLIFDDGVAKDTDGEVIGIKLNEKIINPIELPKPFYQKEVKIYDKKIKVS